MSTPPSPADPSGFVISSSKQPSTLANIALNGSYGASSSSVPLTKKRKPSLTGSEKRDSAKDELHTDDDSASVRPGKDHKRTRVHFSCVECHRRKQKCDRKEPCSQCVARKVPHLCRPFLNGVEDPNTITSDVNARLNSIETLLSRLVSALPVQALHTFPSVHGASSHSSPDVSSLTASGEEIFHPQSRSDNAPRQALPQKPPPSGLFPASLHATGVGRSGYGWGLREGRMINLTDEESPDLKTILSTLRESGISKGHLEWVIAGVPGRRMADGLIELYFRDIDWTRYKMNRNSFMKRYNIFFDCLAKNPTDPKIDGDTLRWLPLLFIVLAIATLSAPHELVARDDQQDWSRRFYGSARSGLEYAKALQRDNLDVLFAGLLASRYMLLTRRPAEGSTPLTTAFQQGLYRDGTVLNLTDKKEIEIRRRAWAQLYHLDRTIALLVGRPPSISDAHTDTRAPANLDDDELESEFDPEGHPLSLPTLYTYVILRHKLAEIMGRIAYHTFAVSLPDYTTVLSLDRDLLAWRDSLPAFFALTNPDTSMDKQHTYLFVQRHLLACEWYYTRITLNRPYLLRRKPQDGRYAYSKTAAIESATADLLNRRAFVMGKGNLVVNSGGYRVLNSYMVLGVTIKLDPQSPQADELRQLLNVVSGKAPDAEGLTSEPLVKEELAIVEFLTAKGNAAAGKQRIAGRPTRGEDQTPVDLLLGLAKTRSGRRAAEEEKRQLRLQQQRMEMEERQAALRSRDNLGSSNSTSPWDYVAPSMPGLDVHQPFGSPTTRREPRPLQPPPAKRSSGQSQNPWPANLFETLTNQTPLSSQNLPIEISSQKTPSQNSLSVDQYNFSDIPDVSMSITPNQSVNHFDQTLLYTQDGQTQYTQGNYDAFNFGDLGFNTGLTPSDTSGSNSFNPFALAQNQGREEGSGSEGMGEDEQTQFLNYILTKIANSQPEVQ
ncbi:hypothetical protein BD324DRAFT_391775 [Kockovaella imperatae]|uniref:Zn(2)-C6 fungal-type domain-containing protein n=1 Tax=Kockovaella imperatae TaxID=4999 RepID=A0A1Y1UJP2_9TREE|nr:hypothetical protein BD324DRAFT_391775 [Kockovaella imperatae]ORX37686.1 hypothetical protein BD324DRAFT_391775 [Kockovaella imperatae]